MRIFAMNRSFNLTIAPLIAFTVIALSPCLVVAQRDAGEETSNTATAELVEDPDGDQYQADLPSPARRESLRRRAGEIRDDGQQGRAVVLGMHIQEVNHERAHVVDVGPATPAFDAGIRKGDEIVSFDGFRADTYRDWIDGMRRLVTDAPDGDSLPIVIDREGKRLNLRLRVPVANAGSLANQDEVVLNQQAVPGQPVQPNVVVPGQPTRPLAGGVGDNILIADAFGDAFGMDGGVTEAAIAELFKLHRPQSLPPATGRGDAVGNAGQNLTARGQQLAAGTPGQRIGLAGFRDDANGLFVMVDVGGLQPGTYLVGIDDPGALNTVNTVPVDNAILPERARTGRIGPGSPGINQSNTDVTPADGGVIGVPRSAPPSGNPPGSGPAGRTKPGSTPAGNAPAGSQPDSGTGTGLPQGRLDSPKYQHLEFSRTVLAQVADQATPAANSSSITEGRPTDIPATERPEPSAATPATGEVLPSNASPTGIPRAADARRDSSLITNDGVHAVPGIPGPAIRIGTLTVDQSGTGRLQQTVEGVQVQGIVGQALMIYSMNAMPNRTLPPNLDAAADPGAPAVDTRTQPVGSATEGAVRRPPSVAAQSTGERGITAAGFGGQVPVAGGLIRLMSETTDVPGRVPSGGTTTAGPETPNAQLPGVDTPSVPAPDGVQ
jgi:hypothetical protein